MTDIFEKATRKKLRFPSEKGDLTVEQLWDLPLTSSRSNLSLDGIARAINTDLKNLAEESFVVTTPDPRKALLELQLDILKHIIAVKLAEAESAKKSAEKAAERAKLLAALGEKEEQELTLLSKEAILARLKELES